MQIRPFPAALGAEVLDVDLGALDDATFATIRQAFLDHLVLVFRDQDLSPGGQISFSRRFGDLAIHVFDNFLLPGHPEILQISTLKDEKGNPIGLPDGGANWHTDLSYAERPSLGSLLYAHQVPDSGGDTLFANMYAAYEALPESMRTRLDGLKATFIISRLNKRHARSGTFRLNQAQVEKVPEVVHPVVRTHPETGRKALYINPGHTSQILGMSEAESDSLLDELFEHQQQDRFCYRHAWRRRDAVFWDNRCTLHRADPPAVRPASYVRHMHRTTIAGDKPF